MKRSFAFAGIAGALTLTSAGAYAGSNRTAIFAGGCYWSMEHDIKHVAGVSSVTSGFVPYPTDAPTDPSVRGPRHFEAVRVTYDPAKISYPVLVAHYLRMIDPTDDGGQFCDRGPSYRTAIFIGNATESQAARAAIVEAQPIVKRPIVTRVMSLPGFKAAPMDQQDWARKNSVKYARYRQGCGKDRVVHAVWGGR